MQSLESLDEALDLLAQEEVTHPTSRVHMLVHAYTLEHAKAPVRDSAHATSALGLSHAAFAFS